MMKARRLHQLGYIERIEYDRIAKKITLEKPEWNRKKEALEGSINGRSEKKIHKWKSTKDKRDNGKTQKFVDLHGLFIAEFTYIKYLQKKVKKSYV